LLVIFFLGANHSRTIPFPDMSLKIEKYHFDTDM